MKTLLSMFTLIMVASPLVSMAAEIALEDLELKNEEVLVHKTW